MPMYYVVPVTYCFYVVWCRMAASSGASRTVNPAAIDSKVSVTLIQFNVDSYDRKLCVVKLYAVCIILCTVLIVIYYIRFIYLRTTF